MCGDADCGIRLNDLSVSVAEHQIAIFVNRETFGHLLEQIPFRGYRRAGDLTDDQKLAVCEGLIKFAAAVNAIGSP